MINEAERLALVGECAALAQGGPDRLLKAKACVALIHASIVLRSAPEPLNTMTINRADRIANLTKALGRQATLDEMMDAVQIHDMTPAEIEAQRPSFVREMTARYEYGELDFEQCAQWSSSRWHRDMGHDVDRVHRHRLFFTSTPARPIALPEMMPAACRTPMCVADVCRRCLKWMAEAVVVSAAITGWW